MIPVISSLSEKTSDWVQYHIGTKAVSGYSICQRRTTRLFIEWRNLLVVESWNNNRSCQICECTLLTSQAVVICLSELFIPTPETSRIIRIMLPKHCFSLCGRWRMALANWGFFFAEGLDWRSEHLDSWRMAKEEGPKTDARCARFEEVICECLFNLFLAPSGPLFDKIINHRSEIAVIIYHCDVICYRVWETVWIGN